jgi:homoaconitase/3-isopropylmalate dehydratase large subunit
VERNEKTVASNAEILYIHQIMMTITEKILAAHCGKKEVVPGELINAKLDLVLANDITAPISIKEFRAAGAKKVFDRVRRAMQPASAVLARTQPLALFRGRENGH